MPRFVKSKPCTARCKSSLCSECRQGEAGAEHFSWDSVCSGKSAFRTSFLLEEVAWVPCGQSVAQALNGLVWGRPCAMGVKPHLQPGVILTAVSSWLHSCF